MAKVSQHGHDPEWAETYVEPVGTFSRSLAQQQVAAFIERGFVMPVTRTVSSREWHPYPPIRTTRLNESGPLVQICNTE